MGRPSAPVRASNILSIVLAGGRGSRLHDLTDAQAKPALPVGPSARLIDFTLANVANSGFERALLLTQYAPETLHQHIETMWRDGSAQPRLTIDIAEGSTFGGFNGTADAVAKVMDEIERHAPEYVVILAGDHLYQMDYRLFVERHLRSGARVTVGAVHVPLAAASEFGVMALDAEKRIIAFDEKPEHPAEALDRPGHALASMGIYVFNWSFLRALLEKMMAEHDELDFGKHVLPLLVAGGDAFGYALPSRGKAAPLWRDLGTVDAYHGVHGELLAGRVPLDPAWPIPAGRTTPAMGRPATDLHGLLRHSRARLTRCSIGEGATIGERSVLDDVVILPGARIGRDCMIDHAIVTSDAIVPDGFDLAHALTTPGWCTISEGGICILSSRALETYAGLQMPAAAARLNDNAPLMSWADQPSRKLLAAPGA